MRTKHQPRFELVVVKAVDDEFKPPHRLATVTEFGAAVGHIGVLPRAMESTVMLPEQAAETNENAGRVAVGQFLRMAPDDWFVSAEPKVKPT